MDHITTAREPTADAVAKPYSLPQLTDYGSLQQLTAQNLHGGVTDVPKGSPAPAVFC